MIEKKAERESLLDPLRVLDLTDENGFLCGRILGDLGADVIKIEPPGGDPGRNIAPFYHDIPDPEKSLYWFSYNSNKRSITLNIETSDGKEIFRRLVRDAHFVIESFPQGYMESLGLGYSALSQINPRVIVTSITPFGHTGPYKDYKSCDLVNWALSGYTYLGGSPDAPPARISFPQSAFFAGAEAALGTMIAHHYREATGEGQHVDVSTHEALSKLFLTARLFWEFQGINVRRAGSYRAGLSTAVPQRLIWPSQDGHVCFVILGGTFGAYFNRQLVEWMDSEGMAPEFLKEFNWDTFDLARASQEDLERLAEPVGKFFMAHTKAELYEGALKRGIMFYPVSTVKDIMEDPQLKARGYFTQVEHPELNAHITYPEAFVKLSQAPIKIYRRAPLIGEHNEEVYGGELGFSPQELVLLKQGRII